MILPSDMLTADEAKAISGLLSQTTHDPPSLEDIWMIMDRVWDEMGCDNRRPEDCDLGAYYSHPIWTLNAIFSETDETSIGHRRAIARWIAERRLLKIVDFGGGGGYMARLIAEANPQAEISICEPYPSAFGLRSVERYDNICFVDGPSGDYDCLLAIDVLEHVVDPLQMLDAMVQTVRIGGYLLVANNFYPVIKCHLPCTFHLRYSFNLFARMMGLQSQELCRGSHARIYKKQQERRSPWPRIRRWEGWSKRIFPVLDGFHGAARPILNPFNRILVRARKEETE